MRADTKERIKIIEYNTGKKMTDDEKLQLAFEMQDLELFMKLLDSDVDTKSILDIAEKMNSWKLSILQADMLKEIYKRMKR